MTEWLRQGSRVYSNGEGHSYNCTNIATAKQLHQTLTNYEKTYNTLTKLRNALIKDGYTELADLIKTSTSTSPSRT